MPPGSRELRIRRAQNTRTHELLKVLPVLPVEAPIRLPDPIPSGVVLRPSRKEDYGVVGLNLAAEIQLEGGKAETFQLASSLHARLSGNLIK